MLAQASGMPKEDFMNLSEARKLKDGDEIEFFIAFYPLTQGKKYKVKQTTLGPYITDDNGVGVPVTSNLAIEQYFRVVEVPQ